MAGPPAGTGRSVPDRTHPEVRPTTPSRPVEIGRAHDLPVVDGQRLLVWSQTIVRASTSAVDVPGAHIAGVGGLKTRCIVKTGELVTTGDGSAALPAETRVEQVALRVRSVDDVAAFYREVIGLGVERDGRRVRLSAGDGEPLLVLREDQDAPERPATSAGLYHVALRVPDREALGAALTRIQRADHPLDGAADHVASEALYLTDPVGNGLEVYTDRPRDAWEYTDDGQVRLPGDPLDLAAVEAAAPDDPGDAIHPDADVGHVHLAVTDLDRSTAFYRDALGFGVRRRKPRATFLAGGEYHHHLAVNTRGGRTRPFDADSLGLESVTFSLPAPDVEATARRLERRDLYADRRDGSMAVTDPDGVPVRFVSR